MAILALTLPILDPHLFTNEDPRDQVTKTQNFLLLLF